LFPGTNRLVVYILVSFAGSGLTEKGEKLILDLMMNRYVRLRALLTKGVFLVCGVFQLEAAVAQCPDITTPTPVDACDSYILPAITGADLTAGAAYYTAPGGGGTQFFPGDAIPNSITLFLYDELSPGCFDEEMVTIVVDNTPPSITCPPGISAFCSVFELPAYTNYTQFIVAGGNASDDINLNIASFVMISEVYSGAFCS
jgi:hypothetical protein